MNQSTLLKHRRYFVCMLLLIGAVLGLKAQNVTIGDFDYGLITSSRTATVKGYHSSLPIVVVPETVSYDGIEYSVTSIGSRAFSEKSIQSITLPSSVKTIGQSAFYSCSKLTTVNVGSSLQTIEKSAFQYCSNLTKLTLPDALESIGDQAFYGCTSVTEITVGSGLKTIGGQAFVNCSSFTALKLPSGFTSMGSQAFMNCKKLTIAQLGESLTSIPRSAFEECISLSEMIVPATVKSIDARAFYNCSGIAVCSMQEGLESIGDQAFYNNSGLTSMSIPGTVKTIGTAVFAGCSNIRTLRFLDGNSSLVTSSGFGDCPLSTVYIGRNISISEWTSTTSPLSNHSTLKGITYGDKVTEVSQAIAYNCPKLRKVTFGNSVKIIGTNAFSGCAELQEVRFPQSLNTIENSAFYNCGKLTNVEFPESLNNINESAFANCTGIASVHFDGSDTHTLSLGESVFNNCTALSALNLPGNLSTIGSKAFQSCSALQSVTFGEDSNYKPELTVESYAFADCPLINTLTFPGRMTSIGNYAFMNDTAIAQIIFEESNNAITLGAGATNKRGTGNYVSGPLFGDGQLTKLFVGRNIQYESTNDKGYSPFYNQTTLSDIQFSQTGSVTYCNDCLFYGASSCEALTLPESLTSIGYSAFRGMTALKGITIPNNVTEIGTYAFADNSNLKNAYLSSGCSQLKEGLFSKCVSLESINIPPVVTDMDNYMFNDCKSLTRIIFEESKDAVRVGVGGTGSNNRRPLFGDCPLTTLFVGRNINYSTTAKGISPFQAQDALIDIQFSQTGSVTYCDTNFLYGVRSCKKLTLPESLTSIGNDAFRGMKALEGITIPKKVTSIGTYAFAENKALKYAIIHADCPVLKNGLFADCNSLELVTIPPAVNQMELYIFRNCKSLANVTFEGSPEILTIKEDWLFSNCPIETVNLDRTLSYNTDEAQNSPFYKATTLKNLNLGENVKVIDKYMFYNCSGLEEVTLPEQIESVGLWGFRGCTSLRKVNFGNQIKQISDYAFNGCTSLDNVVFPESMTSISDNSFSDCTSLTTLDLGKKLMIIGPSAFKGDVALNWVEFPETLYGLGVESFSGCTSLPGIEIKGISSVGKQAFQNCTGLKWVSLSPKTTSLGQDSFDGCTGIDYVKSYAEFPPEGLANFPAKVVANGTLFVPAESMEEYEFSDLWEDWFKRPITDDVLVSFIRLDKNEISFKATETVQLSATVGEEDAVNKGIVWKSSDINIATVDDAGLVTAVAVGKATITARAADGSAAKDVCAVTVNPTAVETITLSQTTATVKKNRELSLKASVLPLTATVKDIVWTSSDKSKATVDNNGVVKTLLAGDITITAAAKDGSGVTANFALTVINPARGDSNDNDVVNVTDAVNTANYAVGKEVADFCFEAADINNDRVITASDATGTISIVMDQTDVAADAPARVRALADVEADKLVADDFTAAPGNTGSVFVKLDNTIGYVALQADVVNPEGMELAEVKAGERAETFHGLTTARIADNVVRVILFDIENHEFAPGDGAILELVVNTSTSECGDIAITNIIASDAEANEYRLAMTGGHNNGTTGINGVYADGQIHFVAVEGGIEVCNADGEPVRIYTVDGKLVHSEKAAGANHRISLSNGIYVVTAGNAEQKVATR